MRDRKASGDGTEQAPPLEARFAALETVRQGFVTWPANRPFPWSGEECAATLRDHHVWWPYTVEELLACMPGRWEMTNGFTQQLNRFSASCPACDGGAPADVGIASGCPTCRGKEVCVGRRAVHTAGDRVELTVRTFRRSGSGRPFHDDINSACNTGAERHVGTCPAFRIHG